MPIPIEGTDFSDSGRGKTPTRYFYTYIHNVYAGFFRDLLDYFLWIYPRFEWWVMGTYDKAVEYLTKQEYLGSSAQLLAAQVPREQDMPMKAAIVMNPLGEFAPADANAGGRQLWRFPNLAFGFVNRAFDPIYQDDHIKITPGFQRMKGEVECIMMVESFYEYCDLRMYLYSIFGGMERVIEPQYFTSFLIIDPELVNFEYSNQYTGERYRIDWSSTGAINQLVKTTNRNELVLPVTIKPQLTLTGLSDASERYGGTDKLPTWKLNATISYEIELPAFVYMETDYLVENFNMELRYGSAYSQYNDYAPPVNRELYNVSWDWGLDSTSNSALGNVDTTGANVNYVGDYVWKTRYFHTVTQQEVNDNTSTLDITLPETIQNPNILIVNSKYGELLYKDHYDVTDSGTNLRIFLDYVDLSPGQVLELYIYEPLTTVEVT
jgi:hypothetical protein